LRDRPERKERSFMEPLSASCEVLKTEDVGCRRQSFGSDPPSLRRIPEQPPAS
jgi:hypothetical protein